jgi:hypothetical protein
MLSSDIIDGGAAAVTLSLPPPPLLHLFVCVAALGDVLGSHALVEAPQG